MYLRPTLFAVSLATVVSSTAFAQSAPPAGAGAPPAVAPAAGAPAVGAPAGAPAAADGSADERTDGVRFRWGISGGGGFWVLSSGGQSLTAGLGGFDIRLGVQINNYLAVYAQPHLSFGVVSQGRVSGGTGVAATDALVELTLFNRLAIGAGGGAGVLNNPAGPDLHFRLAGYPLVGKGENGIRRHGLMVGADLRIFFLNGGTAIMPFFGVGYEGF